MPLLALLLQLLSLFAPDALAGEGILKVHSAVAGAEVFVDGQSVGPAPVTRFLAEGPHQLRVVADHYDPFVRRVDIAADKTVDVNATLTPGNGTVEFTGPSGSRLSIDGADRGPLPIRVPAPTAGKHAWRVEAPGFEPAEGAVDFVPGRNYLIDVALESSAGVLVVESTPAGATVLLDGAEVGTTPLRMEGVASGKHGLELRLADHASALRGFDNTDGKRTEVKATLPATGATITLATGSDDAKVFVNEVPVGTGATVKIGPLEKGRAHVRVVLGEREATDTVAIPSRGAVSLRVAGDTIVERKPLTQRWGFWAAVGGGVAAGTTAAVLLAPEPAEPPTGDTVVVLP
jgi:hypothetical protein